MAELEFRDVAQPGSAPQWGCGGRKFESSHPDHILRFKQPYQIGIKPGIATTLR